MIKQIAMASGLVVLLHASFNVLAADCPERAVSRPGPLPTTRHQVQMEGILEHRIVMPRSRYVAGERVIVHRFLTNLSSEPLQICETCYGEGVHLHTTMDTPVICGYLADHAPGFQPRMGVLAPGEMREDEVDLTDRPCTFTTHGPGEYKVTSRYCYDGDRQHGIDPPLYCVHADDVLIEIATE